MCFSSELNESMNSHWLAHVQKCLISGTCYQRGVAPRLQNHITPSHGKLTNRIVKTRRMAGCLPVSFFHVIFNEVIFGAHERGLERPRCVLLLYVSVINYLIAFLF